MQLILLLCFLEAGYIESSKPFRQPWPNVFLLARNLRSHIFLVEGETSYIIELHPTCLAEPGQVLAACCPPGLSARSYRSDGDIEELGLSYAGLFVKCSCSRVQGAHTVAPTALGSTPDWFQM